jgi:hypothetical protein
VTNGGRSSWLRQPRIERQPLHVPEVVALMRQPHSACALVPEEPPQFLASMRFGHGVARTPMLAPGRGVL